MAIGMAITRPMAIVHPTAKKQGKQHSAHILESKTKALSKNYNLINTGFVSSFSEPLSREILLQIFQAIISPNLHTMLKTHIKLDMCMYL